MSAVILLFFLALEFLGLADAGNDILHMLNGDGLDTLLVQLQEQLGDTGLDVVDDFLAAFLMAERLSERLDILLQQFIGILVDLEKTPTQVDGDVLLHFASNSLGVMVLR